jgi:hypothetical protein
MAKGQNPIPSFLLTFEFFNRNVHNCMVDSGASSNVMPLKFYEKLNAKPENFDIQIIQLDRSRVKVIGELNNVLIRLSFNPKVHQTIDIILVYIPCTYGLLLSRDWFAMLNGYFSIDWSHLWLPYNGKPNQIRVDREFYMKHVVKDLNDSNEPIMFNQSILGNYSYDSFFGNTTVEISSYEESSTQFEILHCTQIVELNYDIVDNTNTNSDVHPNIVSRDKLDVYINSTNQKHS